MQPMKEWKLHAAMVVQWDMAAWLAEQAIHGGDSP